MRAALRILLTDVDGRPLPPGARTIAIALACATSAGIVGAMLLYAVDLRAQGPLSVQALALAAGPALAGILLACAALPALSAARRLRRWHLFLFAAGNLLLTTVIALSLIQVLHDDCQKIPGCTQRAAVIYVVSFAQFLYFAALLASWFAAFAALARGLWLSLTPSD